MSVITDLYTQLFGKDHIKDGDVISFSEHGRVGGLSTGQGYKITKGVEEVTYIDEASSSITYIGKAGIGVSTSSASWQIKKILTSGSVTSITYAGGTDNYDQVWNDRSGLSYS